MKININVVIIPIVTLDRIYLEQSDNVIFLDCTRLLGSNSLVSRNEPDNFQSVENQIKTISEYLLSTGQKQIFLADDVIFSGKVINSIIREFQKYEISVVGLVAGLSTFDSYCYFNNILRYGIMCDFIMTNINVEEICERDFFYGVVGSGISVKCLNGIFKAPYFLPFGDPEGRASIPREYAQIFSQTCLDNSIMLWDEIERLSNISVVNGFLPEQVIGTKTDEAIVLTLKKAKEGLKCK